MFPLATPPSCINCVPWVACDRDGFIKLPDSAAIAAADHAASRDNRTMPQTITRSTLTLAALCAGALALGGCFGPTYGTGKTSSAQLMEDLGSSLSLGSRRPQAPINYTPRPGIVEPADTSVLPPPQQNIADASEAWPESPEQRRARVLADVDAGRRDPNFITDPNQAAALGASEGPGRISGGARRVYLTDPPSEYRQPAQTAQIGDLGESEAAKERARKRAQGERTGLRRFLPWL